MGELSTVWMWEAFQSRWKGGLGSCRLVFPVRERRCQIPAAPFPRARAGAGAPPTAFAGLGGVGGCGGNWRQAGLFPNRDLGSHDLSAQLSPEVLPCSPSRGRARGGGMVSGGGHRDAGTMLHLAKMQMHAWFKAMALTQKRSLSVYISLFLTYSALPFIP